jgi:hypothetical protein
LRCDVAVSYQQKAEVFLDQETFVNEIRARVRDSAVDSTIRVLTQPPGRSPKKDLLELSGWFKQLAPDDRENVERLIKRVANITVFGFLCVLHGVRVIKEGSEVGDFELKFRCGGIETALNGEPLNMLHDIFNSE